MNKMHEWGWAKCKNENEWHARMSKTELNEWNALSCDLVTWSGHMTYSILSTQILLFMYPSLICCNCSFEELDNFLGTFCSGQGYEGTSMNC